MAYGHGNRTMQRLAFYDHYERLTGVRFHGQGYFGVESTALPETGRDGRKINWRSEFEVPESHTSALNNVHDLMSALDVEHQGD